MSFGRGFWSVRVLGASIFFFFLGGGLIYYRDLLGVWFKTSVYTSMIP